MRVCVTGARRRSSWITAGTRSRCNAGRRRNRRPSECTTRALNAASADARVPPPLGRLFKGQVTELMGELATCTPHYCRCIKPNETKRARDFDVQYTQNQVQVMTVEGPGRWPATE